MERFVHVPATCMHENVMVRHVCDSFSPFLTPRPAQHVWTARANTAPQRASPFQCAEPCALLVAEGWSLPLILHLIPSALKQGSAKVERLRPRLIASRDAVNRGVKNEQKTTGSFSG